MVVLITTTAITVYVCILKVKWRCMGQNFSVRPLHNGTQEEFNVRSYLLSSPFELDSVLMS